MIRVKWTDQEVKFLVSNYGHLSCLEISVRINRSHKSVESKVFKLISREIINRKNVPILIGGKYGRLTVIEKSTKKDRHGSSFYTCKCDCGKIVTVPGNGLNIGSTKSCGCYNRDRVAETHRLEIGESSLNKLELTYKTNAKNRRIPYSLTREQFRALISQNCHWCGEFPKPKNYFFNSVGIQTKLDVTEEWANKNWIYVNGIDRINNDTSVGYDVDNCAPCCEYCNRIKLDKTEKDFLEHIEKIHNFQQGKKK